MPKRPQIDHPLRSVRKELGPHATQKWMAQFLGLATITVTKIENGKLNLTQEQRFALALKFGVDPKCLDPGEAAIDVFGNPFTKESVKRLDSLREHASDAWISEFACDAAIYIASLLRLARKKGKFVEQTLRTISALGDLDQQFALMEVRSHMMDLTTEPFEKEAPVFVFYSPLSLANTYGFPPESKWDPTDQVTITGKRCYVPQINLPPGFDSVTGKSFLADRHKDKPTLTTGHRMYFEEGEVKVGKDKWEFDFCLMNFPRITEDESKGAKQKSASLSHLAPWSTIRAFEDVRRFVASNKGKGKFRISGW